MGQKPYEPTQKDRDEVAALIGMGLSVAQVAQVKGIARETLHRHHQEDIDRGRPMALAKVMDTAFKLATSGKCPSMTMFWLKTQAGWREKDSEAEKADSASSMSALVQQLKASRAQIKASTEQTND